MPYFKFTLHMQDGATEENKEEQEKKEGDDDGAHEKVIAKK